MSRISRTERATAACRSLPLCAALSLVACGGTESLLTIQFDDENVGDVPKVIQEVGTLRTRLDFGTVRIQHTPTGGFAGNWMELTQGRELTPPAQATAVFAAVPGEGHYLVTMRLFVPTNGSASIVLTRDGSLGFFDLRLDDPSGRWFPDDSGFLKGRYPLDRPFSVAINVNIGATSSTEVTLLGEAHGSFKVEGVPANDGSAQIFSRILFQSDVRKEDSSFLANDISVIFTPPDVLEQSGIGRIGSLEGYVSP